MRGTYAELLERVGRARLERGDVRGALDAAERGLAVDGLSEALWRLALEAEGAPGLREAIAERYEVHFGSHSTIGMASNRSARRARSTGASRTGLLELLGQD